MGAFRLFPLLLVALAGCAQPSTKQIEVSASELAAESDRQREAVVRELVRDRSRLYQVSRRVLMAAAPMCGEVLVGEPGFLAANAAIYDKIYEGEPDWQRAARSATGLGERVKVVEVLAGGLAEKAGIRPGDEIERIGEVDVGTGQAGLDALGAAVETVGPARPLAVRARREGGLITFSVPVVPACDYPVRLDMRQGVNAFADGRNIFVTRELMKVATRDDELAVVIGHELAHNTMGHIDAQKQNMGVGAAIGLLADIAAALGGVNTGGYFSDLGAKAGAGGYSQEFEAEADYVGLYATALADYDIQTGADLWRRMAVVDPGSIEYASTHPTSAYRAAALEKVAAEIERKRSSGLALAPDVMPAPKRQQPDADMALQERN